MKAFYANLFRAGVVLSILSSALVIPARANPVSLHWDSPGSNVAGYYYVSPYTATIVDTNQLITLYCIDFNHEIAPPNDWDANILPLTSANVDSFQYGNPSDPSGTWLKYEEAAYFISQLTSAPNQYWQDVFQYDAWNVFLYGSNQSTFDGSENAVGGSFASDVAANSGDALSAIAWTGWTPSQGWYVVTPDPKDSAQEFLTYEPQGFIPVTTPEPVSIVLLGTACLGFAVYARKRAKRSNSVA